MDPYNRGSEEYGHDDGRGMGADWQDGAGPGSALERYQGGGLPAVPEDRAGAAQSAVQGGQGAGARPGPARPSAAARTTRLVAGAYLLTVNPVDGSEIEPCPPGEHPGRPERSGPLEREERRAAAAPPAPVGPAAPARQRIVERGEERERLVRLLSRGRSVRVTGPSGSGRTALLDAVAADCAELAPDGLVRLSGHRRTAGDLLHELFAAVYHAPLHRPGPAELAAVVRDIGAVVVLDDIEFGGTALDELLAATPECAFLISATPEVAAPSADSHIEEVFLGGLGREACLEILEQAVERPLAEDEVAWASMLWFESEGLPLRFVQAGGLLRQRSVQGELVPGELVPGYETGYADPLPTIAEAAAPAALLASRLSPAARETLRFAVALGGACPHQTHLPALAGDTHADAAVGELLGCGLLTAAGSHYRLAAGAAFQLESAGYGEGADDRALTAAQHYAWWAGHPSVTAERVAAEADAMLAALAVLVGRGEAGEPAAAVLLARTAAPALAAAGAWGAWERALRYGQEAARLTGESAEEAYFHHELGILALCTGNLDRARAQLEAAISLRGALSDRHGAVAGRRALALVTDRAAGLVPGIPIAGAPSTGGPATGEPGPGGRPALPRRPAAGDSIRAGRVGGRSGAAPGPDTDAPTAPTVSGLAAAANPPTVPGTPAVLRGPSAGNALSGPPGGPRAPYARPTPPPAPTVPNPVPARTPPSAPDPASLAAFDGPSTLVARQAGGLAVPGFGAGPGLGKRSGFRRTVLGGARRNAVAAGAGALLVAVLGTVVTLGATSNGGNGPSGTVTNEQPSTGDEENGYIVDEPTAPGATPSPKKSGKKADPSASESGSASPGGKPSSGSPSKSGEPTETRSSDPQDPESPEDPPKPPTPTKTSKPTTKPPSTRPPSSITPTPTESEPEDPPSTPEDPSEPISDTSNSASGPVPVALSGPAAAGTPVV